MRTSVVRWLVALAVSASAATCAEGAAPFVSSRPWTGTIEAHGVGIEGAALTADGNTLVTTAINGKAVVIDLRTGKILRQRKFDRKLYQVALVNREREFACVVGERKVHIVDLATLKTRFEISIEEESIGTIAADRDGKRLVLLTGKTIGVCDVPAAKLVWRLRLAEVNYPVTPAFSPDGKTLAVGVGYDEPLRLFDAANGREVGRVTVPDEDVPIKPAGGMAYTADGRSLVCASRRYDFVHVWDARSARLTASMTWRREDSRSDKKPPPKGSFSLAVSPDGRTAAVAGLDDRLRLLELSSGVLRQVIASGYCERVSVRALFCPDGRLIRFDVPKRGSIDVSDWRRAAAKPRRLSEDDLKRAWDDLGSKDAEAGFRAVSRLLTAPERQALTLLAGVPRIEPLTQKQIARLIADLDHDDYDAREQATADLKRAGPRVEKALRAAMAKPPSVEMTKRANAILARFTPLRPERLRFLRAVEVLEAIGTPEARKQLERLAGGAAGVEETDDAKAALARARKAARQ